MLDAHIHIEKGPYDLEWIKEFVDQGIAMGMDEINLLEHSHRFTDFAPAYKEIRAYSRYQEEWLARRNCIPLESYLRLVRECKRQSFPIRVRFGLEVCYIPGYEDFLRPFIQREEWDFVTGSVHWLHGFGFDHKVEFWEGKDVDLLYRDYFNQMLDLIQSGLFTVLAHPDSIKCFNHRPSYDLTGTYYQLAEALVERQMSAEQNSGLFYRFAHPRWGMEPEMLKIFMDKGVDVITASDAHHPSEVGLYIREMSKELGD